MDNLQITRYNIVSEYIHNQTEEQWKRMVAGIRQIDSEDESRAILVRGGLEISVDDVHPDDRSSLIASMQEYILRLKELGEDEEDAECENLPVLCVGCGLGMKDIESAVEAGWSPSADDEENDEEIMGPFYPDCYLRAIKYTGEIGNKHYKDGIILP